MKKFNFYEDDRYAQAYSKLEFHGTYSLAYRDLPEIIAQHVSGTRAIDFGCGAGRSTRFLKKLGFEVIGLDVSEEMLKKAREKDIDGDYRFIKNDDFTPFESSSNDLVLSAFTFDNVSDMSRKIQMFKGLIGLLNAEGRMINLVSSAEIYVYEWASFSTKDFPENRFAKSGDEVRIVNRAIEDSRPVVDIFMSDDAYLDVYKKAAIEVVATYRPLATQDESELWVNETTISPWVIYVLKRTT